MATISCNMLSPSPLASASQYSPSLNKPQTATLNSTPLIHNIEAHNNVSTRPRPRLALNTDCPRTLPGKGTSALRLDTLSAVSPTVRNTYNNTFGSSVASSTPLPPTSSLRDNPKSKPSLKLAVMDVPPLQEDSSLETTSPISTSSSTGSLSGMVPYTVPSNLRSILSNSPLSRLPHNRSMVTSASTPKVFFPAVKRVAFRAQLVEEIHTSKYTLRHCDIPSREPSPTPSDHAKSAAKREASTTPIDNEEDDECPATPIIGRRKKIRDWTWTLGAIPGAVSSISSTELDKVPRSSVHEVDADAEAV